VPLWKKIGGGARREIPCGVSIGIQDSVEQLLEKIERELAGGLPAHQDEDQAGLGRGRGAPVRERFPRIKLMADANSAYTLADADHLRKLDDFYLMMIEQPLATTTSSTTPSCRRKLQTPICLDECIRTAHHAEQAIKLRACGIINIKLGRVGGFSRRPNACTTWPRPRAFRCGAAACWRRASGARTTWRWPRCRISCCRATFRPASATGSATSSSRRRNHAAGHHRHSRRAGR
jgi:hypothetical protein